MMSNGRGIFVYFVKEEFVGLVFCLEDVCVYFFVCVEYVMRARYVTIIVQEKGYKNLQVRKYHVFDIEYSHATL